MDDDDVRLMVVGRDLLLGGPRFILVIFLSLDRYFWWAVGFYK
jgi:hypothetical protein